MPSPLQASSSFLANPLVSVLYQSDTLLAVDKPQGVIVHSDGTGQISLTDLIRFQLDTIDTSELQALNRLDFDTSGIVLFSLKKETQPLYDRLIAEHQIVKEYRAVIHGLFGWSEHTFTGSIGRDRHDNQRMRISKTGKHALTHVKLISSVKKGPNTFSLLKVTIETGRKHQIRVHLSSAGFPIVGDKLYGRPYKDGLMLHAYNLSFTDPVTHTPLLITAQLPKRFLRLLP